jgi:hypothetical protein
MSVDLLLYVTSGCCCMLLALAGLVLLIVVARRLLRTRKAGTPWMADASEPGKRWAQGAFFLLTSRQDYAYLDEDQVTLMLQGAWGIQDRHQMEATLVELEQSLGGAWDLVRAMLLARASVAVGYMSNDDSWARVLHHGAALQQTYLSWDQMADHLVASRRAWLGMPDDGSGDDPDMRAVLADIEEVKATIWPGVSFSDTSLG